MGMMVIHGAQAGGFSPISIYGVTVNNIVAKAELMNSPLTLFLGSLVFNAAIGVLLFMFLGGRSLIGRTVHDDIDTDDPTPTPRFSRRLAEPDTPGGATPTGNGGAATATLAAPRSHQAAADKVRHVRSGAHTDRAGRAGGVLAGSRSRHRLRVDDGRRGPGAGIAEGEKGRGVADQLVDRAADRRGVDVRRRAAGSRQRRVGRQRRRGAGMPLLVALLLCYLGAIVSAFASSTAILGATIPLAVPLLLAGEVSPIGVVVALAISSTIVDVSPFSTNGALVLANAQDVDRDRFYKQILKYSALVVAIGPLIAWAVMVLPGWL